MIRPFGNLFKGSLARAQEDRMGLMQDEIIKLRRMADMTLRVKVNDDDVVRTTVENLYYISIYSGNKEGEQFSLLVPEGMEHWLPRPAEGKFLDVTVERRPD